MAAKPHVTRGEIRISSITPIVLHDDVEIWEINCDSKYPEFVRSVGNYENGITQHEIHLLAGDYSIGLDPNLTGPTTVTFTFASTHNQDELPWMTVEVSQYTVTVTAYRYPLGDTLTHPDLTWQNDTDSDTEPTMNMTQDAP